MGGAGEKSGPNPTDRAKSGTKRSLLTEASGIPVGLVVAGANRPDMKLVQETLESIPESLPESIEARRQEHLDAQASSGGEQGLCLDAGYDFDEVRAIVQELGYTTHIRSRGEEKKACEAGSKARRWVDTKQPGNGLTRGSIAIAAF